MRARTSIYAENANDRKEGRELEDGLNDTHGLTRETPFLLWKHDPIRLTTVSLLAQGLRREQDEGEGRARGRTLTSTAPRSISLSSSGSHDGQPSLLPRALTVLIICFASPSRPTFRSIPPRASLSSTRRVSASSPSTGTRPTSRRPLAVARRRLARSRETPTQR